MAKKLRFAPIVRVSTEVQEKQGESLKTQSKQIINYVEILNGVIPDSVGVYGQEHATGVQEREKLDKLLEDSSKDLFDAVICCDASRWSRDNAKSEAGLKILKENKIKFYIGTMQYDLYNPEHVLFLQMSTTIGQFQANQSSMKSILNRIELARKGYPANRLPIGRTFNKEAKQWGLKEGFKEKFEEIARLFVDEDKPLVEVARLYGMAKTTLRANLLFMSGEDWLQTFHSDRFNIHAEINTNIPRLLSDETIQKIKQKMQNNKTIFHGGIKNKYLLSRMLICGHCGLSLYGELMNKTQRAYRHRNTTYRLAENISVNCDHFRFIDADILENSIMTEIFENFGDVVKIAESAKQAIPNLAERKSLESNLKSYEKELSTVKKGKDNLFDMIQEGAISLDDVKTRMNELKKRDNDLTSEINKIQNQIALIPTKKEIDKKSQLMKRAMRSYYSSDGHFEEMTFDDKRKMLQELFSEPCPDESRAGIYLSKDNKSKTQPWLYEIKGSFFNEIGRLPKKGNPGKGGNENENGKGSIHEQELGSRFHRITDRGCTHGC